MRRVFVGGIPLALLSVGVLAAAIPQDGDPGRPTLPDEPFEYADLELPAHLTGPAAKFDNTPGDNPITNAGATLGRVLFYDARLSENETVSCGTCHRQEFGFSAPERLSIGLHGETTARHSMALANARFYPNGRFFWDERAGTLEEQVLVPIQDPVEMAMDLDALEARLADTDFYPGLFEDAFGDSEITSDRIARALAQFVRSMVSFGSKYDRAFEAGDGTTPDFEAVFSAEEELGRKIFEDGVLSVREGSMGMMRGMRGRMGAMPPGRGPNVNCAECHGTTLHVADRPRNNGLDASPTDVGAGNGQFKVPSLRNVAVRAPYMHDGRFESLREVVEFYNSGVQASRNVDRSIHHAAMHGLELSDEHLDALVAFLGTLTDEAFLSDPKFSDPFRPSGP